MNATRPVPLMFGRGSSTGAVGNPRGARPGMLFCDNSGNCTAAGPIAGNKVDKKAPTVSCGAADGAWHNSNAVIDCTAGDLGSLLASTR